MEGLLELIQEYGLWVYLLLFAYCALKSGALPLFAGYAAQAGALELLPVVEDQIVPILQSKQLLLVGCVYSRPSSLKFG